MSEFVLAKVTKGDIVFIGEEDSEETRCLSEAKVFNKEEKEGFSFLSMETACKLLKQKMSINT